MPLSTRMLIIAVIGAFAGSFANWAIYSLAWFNPRAISPLSKGPPELSRNILDRIPIFGWIFLRRESEHFGRGHWIRPMLIELAMSVGLAWLYQYETEGNLLPSFPGLVISPELSQIQFLTHAILIWLMTIATFIDFDEKTIPDQITIPGTLLGFLLVATQYDALPPVIFFPEDKIWPLWLTSLMPWDPIYNSWVGLVLALSLVAIWAYALIPKVITLRRGWWKAIVYMQVSTFRGSAWWQSLILFAIPAAGIVFVWMNLGEPDLNLKDPWEAHWKGLLSSVVGMAFGGGMIWSVRVVGYLALRKEAMGFGDVTLMAMIGAYTGWQPTIMIFFLAPLAAVVIAITQWLITGRRDLPFGPYLCAGTLILFFAWNRLWDQFGQIYNLGWFLPAILLMLLVAMFGLLMLIRLIGEFFSPRANPGS